ncbi:MAG: hypothetical protein ACRCUH_10295 [Shewanella sp.]
MSFSRDFVKFAVLTKSSLDDTGRAIALELFSSTIKDCPVDTGRARGSLQTTIGTPATDDPMRTEGQSLAEVSRVSAQFGMGKVIYLTSNLPYIYRLEFLGWSNQAPEGFMRKNAARIQSIVRKAVSENRV